MTALEVVEAAAPVRRPAVAAGRIAKVRGLADARIGDAIGESPAPAGRAPLRAADARDGRRAAPRRRPARAPRRARPARRAGPADRPALRRAREELALSLYGEVQKEVIEATLAEDYGIAVAFRATTTICIERAGRHRRGGGDHRHRHEPVPGDRRAARRPGAGRDGRRVRARGRARLDAVRVLPRGRGDGAGDARAAAGTAGASMDCAVTMTHSGYAARQSHAHGVFDKSMSSTAGDFRALTPIVLMRALRRAGTWSRSRCTASTSRCRPTRSAPCCRRSGGSARSRTTRAARGDGAARRRGARRARARAAPAAAGADPRRGRARERVRALPAGPRAREDGVVSAIRPCRDDERPAILAIVNAAAEAYRGVIPADRWHDPYMPAGELDAEIAAGVVFRGYEDGGALVGVMGIQPVRDVDLIRHAYVAPGRQRGGVGAALLEHLTRRADATHARRHVGGRRLGDPLLRAPRLPARVARRDGGAPQGVLDDPGAPDRDVGRARPAAPRRRTRIARWRTRSRPAPAPDVRALLHRVADDAADWLDSLAERPVRPALTPGEMVVADVLPTRRWPSRTSSPTSCAKRRRGSWRWARRGSSGS